MESPSTWRWRVAALVMAAVVFGGGPIGCKKSAKDKLRAAQGHINDRNLEEAEKLLGQISEEYPFESKREMAKVHRLREEYAQAEEMLTKLWEQGGFDRSSAQLSPKQRSNKAKLELQMMLFYKDWVEALEEQGKTDKLVEVAQRGLEYKETDVDLNRTLVDHYWDRGQKLVDQGKKKAAAEAFEQILELRTTQRRRDKARNRARELRRELFEQKGRANFEEQVKPKLAELETYSLEDETIAIAWTTEVDRRLDPDDEKDAKKVKTRALAGLMNDLGGNVVVPIAGLPEGADWKIVSTERLLEILSANLEDVSVDFQRGEATVEATLSVEGAIAMASELKDAWQKAKKAKQAESGDTGADEGGGTAEEDAEKASGNANEEGASGE